LSQKKFESEILPNFEPPIKRRKTQGKESGRPDEFVKKIAQNQPRPNIFVSKLMHNLDCGTK
jgi:hypothetical protein